MKTVVWICNALVRMEREEEGKEKEEVGAGEEEEEDKLAQQRLI